MSDRTTGGSRATLQRMPGLDGLRAIAIAGVLLFHGGIAFLPGGFLGVDVFFVLSGYLITSLLLGEYARSAAISLPAFYWNRARRLLPALATMLFVVATFASLFMPDSVSSTWRAFPSALSGLSNWWLVLHQQSYFEAIGRPLLFQHTWSLAVETQFYVLWPFVLLLVLPRFGKRGVRVVALLLAVASSAASLFLGSRLQLASSVSISHLYFGTDMRSMGLFLGAALATLWQPSAVRPAVSVSARLALDLAGFVPLVALIWLMHGIDEVHNVHWAYGFSICAVLGAVLIVAATWPGAALGRFLAARPMRWIGERSYGMYLWHWPIYQATRPGIDFPDVGAWNFVLRIFLTALVAELSYRFVEMPVRRGAVERLARRMRQWPPATLRRAAALAVCGVITIGAIEVVLAQRATASYAASLQAFVIPAPPSPKPARATHGRPHHAVWVSPVLLARRAALASPAMLVGDSVMLGASQWIGQSLHVVSTDAVVGRQAMTTLDVVERKVSAHLLEPTMVIDLGNNGTVEEPTLRSLLGLLKRCDQVVIVNARVPRPWQDDNDVLMARVVPQYPNAVLADWYAASAGHPEYFSSDGVHMNAAGAQAYTRLIANAVGSAGALRERTREKRALAAAAAKRRRVQLIGTTR